MNRSNADLLMMYAIDAQYSTEPWTLYESYDQTFEEWDRCRDAAEVLVPTRKVRRRADASQFVTEKVCEWVSADNEFNDYKRTCDNEPRYLGKPKRYCPDCGGKVKIKERMCSIAGIEFPVPVQHTKELDKVHFLVDLTNKLVVEKIPPEINNETWWNNLVQRTREGAEQQLAAMQAALKQAITSAK